MVDWTFDAAEVDWLTERLANFWDRRLASIAPVGFPAYGRLFHPARADDGTWAGWREVAAHHGLQRTPTCDFFHLALPQSLPDETAPWKGSAPERGALVESRARRLVDLLTLYTGTPNAVSFALWDGFGWMSAESVRRGQSEEPAPGLIPAAVWRGPRMRIPGRDYIFCSGRLEDALVWTPRQRQTPHFWWPRDHAWVVAGDVDLPWSIVAGTCELIERLGCDATLEVVPIAEDAVLDPTPEWLAEKVAQAVRDLVRHRAAAVRTSRGTVSFRITGGGRWLESGRGSRTRLFSKGAGPSLEDQLSSHVSTGLMAELDL